MGIDLPEDAAGRETCGCTAAVPDDMEKRTREPGAGGRMTTMRPCPKCRSAERPRIEATDGRPTATRPVGAGCTERRALARADHAPTGPFADGRGPDGVQPARGAFACGKGGPPVRGAGYRRRHRDPTVIFPGRCEPKGVGHD